MKSLMLVPSILLIALSATLSGCDGGGSGKGGPSTEVISAKNIKGSGKTEANNGDGADNKDTPAKAVPADVTEAKKDPSSAKGRVSDWNSITGVAHAQKIAGAPAASKASAKAIVVATSSFTLKQDGKIILPKIEDKLKVTLNGDDAVATINIVVKVSKGGAEQAKLDLTYSYKQNATAGKIDVTGAKTETIDNGKERTYTETGQQKTLDKGDYDIELTLTITTSGSVSAEANAGEVKLTLSK